MRCSAEPTISWPSPSSARSGREWFARFLDLRSGIPSHDRFNAILAAIKPTEFEKCLLSWIKAVQEITGGQVIAIDGKTLRRSFDAATSKSAIHMVSAWATANQTSLGQVVVDAKSNEITAIPKLLEMLEISGCLVTIDAMGCQTQIAQKIIDGKADYVLHVKDNQPTLRQGITDFFNEQLEDDFARTRVRRYETADKGHGRVEARYYYICPVPEDLPDRGPLAESQGDRDRHQRDATRWQDVQRGPLLHPQQVSPGASLRGSGAWALGDREPVCIGSWM